MQVNYTVIDTVDLMPKRKQKSDCSCADLTYPKKALANAKANYFDRSVTTDECFRGAELHLLLSLVHQFVED